MPVRPVSEPRGGSSRLAMVVAFAVALSLLAATLAPRPVDAAAIDTASTTGVHIVGVPLPGSGIANAINDNGAIAGTSLAPDGHAFFWNGQVGHPVDVTPDDINASAGLDINNAGDVVGWRHDDTPSLNRLAYFWDGMLQDPGGLTAHAIDDSGNIIVSFNAAEDTCGNATISVCYYVRDGPAGPITAFAATPDDEVFSAVDVDNDIVVGGAWSWASGTFNSLPGNAAAIDNGTIVGVVNVGGDSHAAILGSPVTPLGTLGGANSLATGSGNGWVVGWSETSAGATHAFYWSVSDGMVDLGTLGGADSFANGVNASGLIVGGAEDGNGLMRAVVWDPVGGYDPDFPPEIDPILFQFVAVGQLLTITPIVTDPDDDLFSVVWSNLPPGASQEGNDLVWTPGAGDVGIHTVTVTATQDSEPLNTTSLDVQINVTDIQPPVLDPIGDQNATVDELLTFTAEATDPDLNNLSLTFLLGGATLQDPPPAGAVINPVSGVFTWTPTAGQEGAHTVTVGVQDLPLPPALSLIDEETFTITVGTGGTPVMVTLNEMVGVTDVITIQLGSVPLLITVDEMVGVGDLINVLPPVEILITEQVGVGEHIAVRPPVEIFITEGVGVSDDPAVRPPVEILVSEGIGVSDDPSVRPPIEILISEQVGVGDDVTMTSSLFIRVTEGVGVSDEPTVLPPVQIVIGERIGVSEAPIVQGSASVSVPEQVGVKDAVTITTINLGDLFDESGNRITNGAIGGSANLMGGGFDPFTSVDISIQSDPVLIATTTANSDGDLDVTFEIPVVPAGAHTIVASGMSQGHPHEVQVPITVLAPVSIIFDSNNPVAQPVAEPGGASGPFQLTVMISEIHPGMVEGGLASSDAQMSLQPVGPGGTVGGDCDSMPNGALILTCEFDDVAVNTYVVITTVGGLYNGIGEDVLVVYDPSLGFATGGGWFYWPDTDDSATSYLGDRTNFGFNMKYSKKGTKVQGSLLLIRHMSDGRIYRVKSNALDGLSLGSGGTFTWASFAGKATYKEPDWSEAIGNHEFIVYVEDHNAEPDRFWIEVSDKKNLPTDLSMARPATSGAVSLEGGNLTVPQGNRNGGPR